MMTKRSTDQLHRAALAVTSAKEKRDGMMAQMYREGATQIELAAALGITQQECSRRLGRVHPTLW